MHYLIAIGILAFILSKLIDGIKAINHSINELFTSPDSLNIFFVVLVAGCIALGALLGSRSGRKALEKAKKETEERELSIREKLKTEMASIEKMGAKYTKHFQRVLDDSFKVRTQKIMVGLTLKNYVNRFGQIEKERNKYEKLLKDIKPLNLKDNSDFDELEKQFRERVTQLTIAQDEREYQAEIKRQMREERQRAEQLEKQQKDALEKERLLEKQRAAIEEALAEASAEHKLELEQQLAQFSQEIADVHAQYERAKSMAQQTKQGHVYVISNIGSFGENVFKIGMTRRLEPNERVKELSGASVPFEFDIHAMISCEDAPSLENALHKELDGHRVNKINNRKEFFNTDIETIINAVEKYHGTVEYVANPLALQYKQTLEAA